MASGAVRTAGLRRASRIYRAPLLAAMLLAALLLMPARSAAAAPDPFFGVSTVGARAADFPRMAAGGIGTYRTMVSWAEVRETDPRLPLLDPDPPPPPAEEDGSAYRWEASDFAIGSAAANGIQPLAVLYGSPPMVSSDSRVPPLGSSDARDGWQRFVRAAVGRYGPQGEFWELHPTLPYRPVSTWQVWNEQNAIAFWHGSKPSPSRYAELLRLTDAAIADVDPSAEILLGGMYGYPGGRGSIDMRKYLKRLYRIDSIQDSFDGVAVHPYGAGIGAMTKQIEDARKVMRRNGDAREPIWITEIGWSTRGPRGWKLVTNPRGQARKLQRAFRVLVHRRARYRIGGAIWFSWRDHDDADCRWCGASGLFDRDDEPKPAWFKLRRIASRGF